MQLACLSKQALFDEEIRKADGNGWVVLNCIIDVHLNVSTYSRMC